MILVPLRLRYCGRTVHEPAAWFIPGDDPAVWLGELLRWGVPAVTLQLYVMPRSIRDRRPCGVLVMLQASSLPSRQDASTTTRPTARMLPYARVGDRLFLPADARLNPEFTADELREKVVADVLVLHPSAGLVGFAASDAIRVSDLLARPTERDATWDRAQPGVAAPPRLSAVEPVVEISIQLILQQGHDDIGSQPASELPAAPREPGNSLVHRAGRWLQEKFAKAVRAMTGGGEQAESASDPSKSARRRGDDPQRRGGGSTRQGEGALRRAGRWMGDKLGEAAHWVAGRFAPGAPQRRNRPTPDGADAAGGPADKLGLGWLAKPRAWARQKITAITAAMEAARNRELHRLMHLLETNPDEGLRYAMPMGGSQYAPTGPPGTRLSVRDPNFDLTNATGTILLDPWHAPWELRERLIAQYRAAADREVRLGRFRRAAYIFAQLLGDFAAAAAVLEQGKYFREAAVLYRAKLKRPLDAARCYDRAGLWPDAIAIYEEQKEFETAGDLFARLERPDDAEAVYRKAVTKLEGRGDTLAAARLLEDKVRAPDEALTLLAAAWPASNQAGPCLDARFDLLGRLGRHDNASRLVAELRAKAPPANRVVVLAQTLSRVAGAYPDRPLRGAAADATRVTAGRRLAATDSAEADSLVRTVMALAPEDRLLKRDGLRYIENITRKKTTIARPAPPRERPTRTKGATLVRKVELHSDVEWQCATSAGDEFWAAGTVQRFDAIRVVLVRARWDGTRQRVEWDVPVPDGAAIRMAADPSGVHPTWVHIIGAQRLPHIRMAATGWFPRAIDAGSPEWGATVPTQLADACYGEHGITWCLLSLEDGLTLAGHRPDGSLVTTRHLKVAPSKPRDPDATIEIHPPSVLSLRDTIYVGVLNCLLMIVRDEPTRTVEFPAVITGLASTWPLIRPRVAVTHERGGFVVWGGSDRGHMQSFATDLAHPIAAFTRDGTLIAVASGEGFIYDTHDRKVVSRASFTAAAEHPIAVLPTSQRDEFALVQRSGVVSVYRVAD